MKNINLKIRPYSVWLSYNMLNKNSIEDMLPPGMKLAKIKISEENNCDRHKLLFNFYGVDSLLMRGSRLEIMTIAKCEKNLHFVVLDCVTNTLQWNPIDRIRGPNGKIKFNYNQEKINYDIISKNNKVLKFSAMPLNLIKMTEDFAVKSNYKCFFRESCIPVYLTFNEKEIMKPVRKLKLLNLTNDYWKEYRTDIPENVFMHEHEMKFNANIPFF